MLFLNLNIIFNELFLKSINFKNKNNSIINALYFHEPVY